MLSPGQAPLRPLLCEDTLQKSDFEANLNMDWVVSGLTIGINVIAGFTGLEHVLTTLKATLGTMNITDQFFFAVPFGSTTLSIVSKDSKQTDSETVLTVINPNLFFVKKRVIATISLAGITLTNLAVLEDINFPKAIFPGGAFPFPSIPSFGPLGGPPSNGPCLVSFANGGRCTLLPSAASFKGFQAQSQSFRFGDAVTLEGQTVSGITVRTLTGINMDPQIFESFKKIDFEGVVCTNPNLAFAVEKIQVEGIPVGPLVWSEFLEFRFLPADAVGCIGPTVNPTPLSALSDFTFSTPIGAVEALLATTNILQQLLGFVTITLSSGDVTIIQELDNTLQPASTTITLTETLNPDRNVTSLTVTAIICQFDTDPLENCAGKGLNLISGTLSVQRDQLTFSTTVDLSGVDPVSLNLLQFSISNTSGPINLSLKVQLSGSPPKFDRFEAAVSLSF